MTLQIRGVHHIVLTVCDPNQSAGFYEKILGTQASPENPQVRWISCGNFLLCFQHPLMQAHPNDCFDEKCLGLDHVGSHQQLHDMLAILDELGISTAGIEFDPDGKSNYVCFCDPDHIQIEFYVGDYHD